MNDDNFNHLIDPDTLVNAKLFFNLHIYARDENGKLSYLSFEQNGSQQYIADRVMPGNTLQSAITQVLKKDFQVDDWFFVRPVEFSDETHDNQGNPVQRVHVYVQVPWFDIANRKVLGMSMHWLDGTRETEPEENYEDFKDLNDTDIRTLAEMLNVHIDTAATSAYRAQYPNDPLTFETLLWDKFSPELGLRYVVGGNHWTIWNIFPDIKEAAPELKLDMPDDGVSEDGDKLRMKFSALNTDQYVSMEGLDFWPLFNHLNSLLEPFHKHFMYFDNLAEGGPSFLVVDNVFDEQALKSIIYKATADDSTIDENQSQAGFIPLYPEIVAILDEFNLNPTDYHTEDAYFDALDEIANDWLLTDLSKAETKDLAESDPTVRKQAPNARAVKNKIFKIQLVMQSLNHDYRPSIIDPMKVEDWNPPRSASPMDFYKEFAYYFGDAEYKINDAVNIYMGLHPEAEFTVVRNEMVGSITDQPKVLFTAEERLKTGKGALDLAFIADLRDGQAKDIEELWTMFTSWLNVAVPEQAALLNPPATFKDYETFARVTGYELPGNLKQLYRLNNGGVSEGEGYNGILNSYELLSIKTIITEWKQWREVDQGLFLDGEEPTYPEAAIKNSYANPKWIPLLRDGGGNNIGVDLDPGTSGTIGQVIVFGRDEYFKYVIANSLEDFIKLLLLQIADSNIVLEHNLSGDSWNWSTRDNLQDLIVPREFEIVAKRKSVFSGSEGVGLFHFDEYVDGQAVHGFTVNIERHNGEVSVETGNKELEHIFRAALSHVDIDLDLDTYRQKLLEQIPAQIGSLKLRR